MMARQALEGVFFDLAFLGVNGLSVGHGITIPSLEEAETAREIISHAQRVVIVADHSKFETITHGKIAELSRVSVVVTDEGLDGELREELATVGLELLYA